MIDGVCASCLLDDMGAGEGNLLPRVYAPANRERLEDGVLNW